MKQKKYFFVAKEESGGGGGGDCQIARFGKTPTGSFNYHKRIS